MDKGTSGETRTEGATPPGTRGLRTAAPHLPLATRLTRHFLIGPRGSGKTTVARLLAERLGWDWVDADDVLEGAARQVDPRDLRGGGRGRFPRQGGGRARGAVRPAALRRLHRRRRGGARGQPGAAAGVGPRRLADRRRRDAMAATAGRRPHRRTPAGADRRRPGGGRGSAARPRGVVRGVRRISRCGRRAGRRRPSPPRSPTGTGAESTNAVCLGRLRVPDRRGHRQLPQRLRRPAALREKHPLARLALRPLFPAHPRPRQPPPARLLAARRPLPVLRPIVLRQLFPRRTVHRLRLRRPLLSRNRPQRARPALSERTPVGHRMGTAAVAGVGGVRLPCRPARLPHHHFAVRLPIHGGAAERHGLRHGRRPARGDAVPLAVSRRRRRRSGRRRAYCCRPSRPAFIRGRSGRRSNCRRGCRRAAGSSAWPPAWPGRWREC